MLQAQFNPDSPAAALSLEALAAAIPSIMSHRPAPDRTERYRVVRSDEVITRLDDLGYAPVAAQGDKPTARDPRFTRHLVRFAPKDTLALRNRGDMIPNLILINSHNGRTAAQFMVGWYRLVCLNGLVVGSTHLNIRMRHTGPIVEQLDEVVHRAAEITSQSRNVIDLWERRQLTRHEANEFAARARVLRFGERAGGYEVSDALAVHRGADDGGSLWQTFNRVQENLSNRPLSGRSANGRVTRSRPLSGVASVIGFNAQLWNLAEEYAAAA